MQPATCNLQPVLVKMKFIEPKCPTKKLPIAPAFLLTDYVT